MTETTLEQQIVAFIKDNFLFSEDGDPLDVDVSFMESEILDSTGVLQLVMFVEQTCGVSVEGHEVTPDNFDSVRRVVDFVRRKRT